jgi:large subunit ribosomal protein L18
MKTTKNQKIQHRVRRHGKIRAKVSGSASLPRLCVFRSSKYIYAQLIDDDKGVTLASISDKGIAGKTKTERAKTAGVALAAAAKKKKIDKVVFDRGGFLYAGRVKALAESVREGGIVF